MSVVERAERKAVLMKQAVDLAGRLRESEAERDALLGRRDSNCRKLRAAGASIKELQEAFGISRSRVQQILRDGRR